MNQPWKVITELANTPGTKDKEAIIRREVLAGNDDFFAGFNAAMNSFITYGVKKIPIHKGPDGKGLIWADFKCQIDKLAAREATGHDARDLVQALMEQSTQDQWNIWYAAILRRDMKCKCTDGKINKIVKEVIKSTGNKAFENYQIPVFHCQLAEDGADHPKKLVGKKMIQLKLDGSRVLTVVTPGAPADKLVQQFSRNGIELVNFPQIVKQFEQVAKVLDKPTVFDGEVMSDNFQALMTQLRRKSNVKTNDAILNLFDIIPYEIFKHGKDGVCKKPQIDRCTELTETLSTFKDLMPNVTVLDFEIIDFDTEEGLARYHEINRIAIANGFEGIMVKSIRASYKCKRNDAWLKKKPVMSVDLTIVGFENGKIGGARDGILGAFVCEGVYDGKTIRVNVGSGFDKEQVIDFWNDRDSLLGEIIEIECDCITQNAKDKEAGIYSVRFPRFTRFRGFTPGQKL